MFFFSRRRGFFAFAFATQLSLARASTLLAPLGLLALLALDPDRLLGALARAGVGVGPLTADGQAATVPDPLVRGDLDLALDVLGDVAAEVAFHLVVAVDPVTDADHFL